MPPQEHHPKKEPWIVEEDASGRLYGGRMRFKNKDRYRDNFEKLCKHKSVEIIEANACPDHIHMLVSIPPKLSVLAFIGYLKGKSSLMIFDRHANLKYKYGNRQFWCKGYYVDTVGRNKKRIEEYIRNQLQEDHASDQITLKEYYDPFDETTKKK